MNCFTMVTLIKKHSTPRKRRNHSSALKAKVALAAVQGDRTLAELTQQFNVRSYQITQCKDQLVDDVAVMFDQGRG